MPEFIPAPQLPQGLAAELIRIKSQNPWGQMAQNLGSQFGNILAQQGQQQKQNLTPDQVQAMLQGLPQNVGGRQVQGPNGPVTIGQTQPLGQVFPRGVPPTLVEQISKQREQLEAQREKNEGAATKGHFKLDQAGYDSLPKSVSGFYKVGDWAPDSLRTVPKAASAQSPLSPEEENALVKASLREKDPLPNSLIKSRGAGAKVLAQSLLKDPAYSPNKAEVGLASGKAGASAGAKLQEAGPPQVLARYAQSTKEVLNVAQQASENYPRYGAQFLNTPYNKLKEQSSPEALQFKQSIADLRGHIAAVLAKGYAPQKEQIDEARSYIPDSITPQQLKEDIPFLNRLIDIQVRGMMTPVKAGDVVKGEAKGKYDDVISKVMGQ